MIDHDQILLDKYKDYLGRTVQLDVNGKNEIFTFIDIAKSSFSESVGDAATSKPSIKLYARLTNTNFPEKKESLYWIIDYFEKQDRQLKK